MKKIVRILLVVLVTMAALGASALVYLKSTGLVARSSPGALETSVARAARRLAVPRAARERQNPIAPGPEVMAEGRAHFADHCASCHANDGSGNTEMGRSLFPPAPDMATVSQALTDGELFYVIEQGVRFTGMPAWGTGTPAGEEASWQLVHFIRHLPQITPEEVEEMAAMNPRSPADVRQEIEAERFLQGDDPAPAEPSAAHVH